MENKKYKVLFFGAGKMGELVLKTLLELDNVEVQFGYKDMELAVVARYDLIFSASYPGRISQDMVKSTALGAVNLHTGLLPEGRGWHPLNWAIIWGKMYTGITIHKIVDSYDAGDICLQEKIDIFDDDNIVTLRDRIDRNVPFIIRKFFEMPAIFINTAKKQDQSRVSYAPKRRPEDSELNLDCEPEDIDCLFRSCDPIEYPAFVMENGVKRIVKNYSIKNGITYEN